MSGDSRKLVMPQTPDSPTPYADAVERFARRESLRLNVPGHSASTSAAPQLSQYFGEHTLLLDVQPLVAGIDKGPDSPLVQSLELAAQAWGARRTWFLTNGASQANRMTALAVAQLGSSQDVVIAQRSAHSSFVDGMILGGITPCFIQPAIDTEHGINHGVSVENFAHAFSEQKNVKAAYVISPSYFGAVADIPSLAQIAHEAGVPLIVDGAWGAHFGFHPEVPENPLRQGADILISSTHKLGGSLGQSAMLHLGNGEFSERLEPLIEGAFSLTQSTSASALLLASLDIARESLQHGSDQIGRSINAAQRLREAVRQHPLLDVVSDGFSQFPDIVTNDPLHVSIDIRKLGRSGTDIREALMSQFDIYLEIATQSCIVAIVGPGMDFDSSELINALEALADPDKAEVGVISIASSLPTPGQMILSPREAFFSPRELISAEAAIGRVSADSLAAYPPGIPNVMPGELITAEVVTFLQSIATGPGGYVRGAANSEVTDFWVVANKPNN